MRLIIASFLSSSLSTQPLRNSYASVPKRRRLRIGWPSTDNALDTEISLISSFLTMTLTPRWQPRQLLRPVCLLTLSCLRITILQTALRKMHILPHPLIKDRTLPTVRTRVMASCHFRKLKGSARDVGGISVPHGIRHVKYMICFSSTPS